ncbi:MAG: thioredoxin domain-containing protein [Candidatus Competibacterales bacterium]
MTAMSAAQRLLQETSPYLRQHAHNPVDWYPWGPEALDKAKAEDKPILLSIGYAACHWCHVMAHESFEDPAVAEVMNRLFVNVKVDREERPDLDKIYQLAYQLLNQRPGGWPLTVVLTPDDQLPFFIATYLPKTPRHGMPAFVDVMRQVGHAYRTQPRAVREQNLALKAALDHTSGRVVGEGEAGPWTDAPLNLARQQLLSSVDGDYGGFGAAPKFPHPTNLERLLRHAHRSAVVGESDLEAKGVVNVTLTAMAQGGIYDHLGGGFCRYATDARWMIPHFEKMLYDNGPLLALYAQAHRAFGSEGYRQVALETAQWVVGEMQSPEGGYYSSLDADSEGEEGRFYVFDRDAVADALTGDEYAVAAPRFGLDQPANFEGRWHLYGAKTLEEVASATGQAVADVVDGVTRARAKLLSLRQKRVSPARDDKILGAWNGLMIKGMATAGCHLQRDDLILSAQRALDFVRGQLWCRRRLKATYKDGQARLNAYLDDYALLADGALALLQARYRREELDFATGLADALLTHFYDPEHGGFFFTAHDHEALIQRPKPLHDDALPAGNGVAAAVLLRLGHLLQRGDYLDAAEATLGWAMPLLQQSPGACGALLVALEDYLHPGQMVILRGKGSDLATWQHRALVPYVPGRYTLALEEDAPLPEPLAAYVPHGPVTAYVCTGPQCSPPVTDFAAFEGLLAAAEAAL